MRWIKQLQRVQIALAFMGFVASISLAGSGWLLANQYESLVEFSQFPRLGVNPFELLAYRYGILAILFLFYVVFIWQNEKPRWQFLMSLSLVVLIGLSALLVISDYGPFPRLGAEYFWLAFVLEKGGVLSLFLAIILVILSGVLRVARLREVSLDTDSTRSLR